MTVILIASAFIALVASPAIVAIWPQRERVDAAAPRTAGQLSSFSAPTPINRG
jgi:hypothetical protein